MRVLHAIQELGAGGAERLVVVLTRGIRKTGSESAVAAAPGTLAGDLGGETFPLPIVGRSILRLPQAAVALDRSIRSWRPDLLHAHNPGMAAVAALATLRGHRVRGLVTVHGVPDDDYRRAARILQLTGLTTVACGPGVASGLSEQGFRVACTIVNGISPAPPPADRAKLWDEWGMAPQQALVVSVGRLVSLKNHALAIAALADVPDAVLAIVGEGPLHHDLAAQAESAETAGRVILTGFRSDARALIGAADIVVLPSQSEGLPLTALEALAAGTPLVATRVRGIRELVDDSSSVLVPPNDAHALAAAIRRVLGDHTLSDRIATAGRELAARYTEEAMVDEYAALYASLLAEQARSMQIGVA